jgi:ACT domain-containing protein
MNQLPEQSINIIHNALERYANNQQPIDNFLYQLLSDSNAYNTDTEIKQTVEQISATIDAISLAYQDIQRYKSNGLTLNIWLRDNLNKAIKDLPQTEQDTIIEAAKSAMNSGNVELFKQLSNGETDINVIAELASHSFTDLNKDAIATNLKDELKLNTLLSAIALETVSTDDSQQESSIAQAYFDAPLDAETDNDVKKVVAAAVEIAKKKNLLAEELNQASTIETTATVDAGMTNAKVAYKVAQKELEPIDALDYLIDKAAARVIAVVDTTCKTVGGSIGASVGAVIGGLFSPAGAALGAKVGRVVGAAAGKKVAEIVNKGVSFVADVAKSAVRTVCEGVQSAGRKIASWLGF